MAKYYTGFIEFSNDLDREISWRKHELSILKNAIPTQSGKKRQAFLRMAIPILYAHWEGFVSNCSYFYLKYVKSKRLKHSELKEQFIVLSLRNKLGLFEAKNIETQTEIVHFLLENFNKRSNIPLKNIINTKSNLKFKVFNEILYTIGIESSSFKRFESIIDDLVDLRNYIAHGENKVVDKKTYEEFSREIIALMNYFKTQLENFALNEQFKQNPVAMTIE